ncbi:hypothetical protein RYZ20_09775 [Thioclava sp. A2]|uniref:hypothetical protein n=1 Tax=Thioclava sp. FCG-A2 TaxID=3080562 RepID=UPI0029529FD8|nr:hypothetical protein [Thioclava sp. A2]MDV7271189.1 hypothetical protein [Thioclava sp. A2]
MNWSDFAPERESSFTGINWWRRSLSGLAVGLILAGCVAPEMPRMSLLSRPAQPKALVANGAVTLAAPRGFCIDQKTLRDDADGIFVLFGHCAAMSGDPDRAKPSEAVLLSGTFSADTSATGGPDQMRLVAEFFASELGRAALARSGRAEDVTVAHENLEGNLLILKVTDASPLTDVARSHSYWRGVSMIGGRMSSLSVMPLKDGAVSDAAQQDLLRQFAQALLDAN